MTDLRKQFLEILKNDCNIRNVHISSVINMPMYAEWLESRLKKYKYALKKLEEILSDEQLDKAVALTELRIFMSRDEPTKGEATTARTIPGYAGLAPTKGERSPADGGNDGT